ncbi:hypothetical protein HYD81_03945 [Mycoplasmopsis bovis]|nr:hypothetical protein [Mycoplasmopsis bovis]QQH42667.1 hypothetical protein HYD81_03945 [Mycoplasmopsis bovis]
MKPRGENQTESDEEPEEETWRYITEDEEKLIDKNLYNGLTKMRIIFEVRWWSRYTS